MSRVGRPEATLPAFCSIKTKRAGVRRVSTSGSFLPGPATVNFPQRSRHEETSGTLIEQQQFAGNFYEFFEHARTHRRNF